jgi:hypothetical protein
MNAQLDALPVPAKRRRFRRSSNARAGQDREITRLLGALNAEITLLREENARLKAAQHESPGLAKLLDSARALPTTLEGYENAGDEAAEMLVEGLVIREALLEVCEQIQQSMAAVKARLSPLAAAPDENGARGQAGNAAQMKLVPLTGAEKPDARASRRRR